MIAKKTVDAEERKERTSQFYSPDWKWQLKYAMVDHKLIEHPEYDIELLKPLNRDYNKMVIHPLEAGNCIEFRNKKNKNYSGYTVEVKNLVAKPRILLKEKEGRLLELTVERDRTFTLIFSTDGKYMQEIIDKIQRLRQILNGNLWTKSNITYTADNDQKKTVEIFPFVPFFAEDEEIIWYNLQTGKGDSNNKIARRLQAITRFRVLEYNYETTASTMTLLSDLEELIVMNKKKKTFGNISIGTLARTRSAISDAGEDNMSNKIVGDASL